MPDRDSSVVSEALPETLYSLTPMRVTRGASALERLLRRGPSSLSATELVTLIIGERRRLVAERVLRRVGLAVLAETSLSALINPGGFGKGSAIRLSAVFEIARRVSAMSQEDRPRIVRPKDVFAEVRDIRRAKKEHLIGLYLDAQNGLIARETISIGSLNTTRSHPREILYPAIEHLALGFILAHNHPSGGLEPSDEDVAFSRAIHRAGEVVGIELYDHVIVAEKGFTSLRERGVL